MHGSNILRLGGTEETTLQLCSHLGLIRLKQEKGARQRNFPPSFGGVALFSEKTKLTGIVDATMCIPLRWTRKRSRCQVQPVTVSRGAR